MDYKFHSLDHHNGADESNTKKDKNSIIDVARKALLNLDESMKDIKTWENERSALKRKICNQNETIHHLAANNGSLTSEVKNLKSQLAETMEKSSKSKVEEFCRADKKIDQLVVNSAVKVICTIESLSDNLVSVHDTMNVFKNENKFLQIKIDKLKAMIRVSSGNSQDIRDRVDEFKNLVFRMDKETHMLKNSTESTNADCGLKIYEEKTKNLAMLMEELKTKLKNDRHALFTGGNPYLSVYLEKIAKLENSSEGLLQQLGITKATLSARSCDIKCSHEYHKDVNQLEELVKCVELDLKTLKSEPMLIGSKFSGESCIQYSKRIGILEKLVATSRSIINKLIIDSKEVPEEKRQSLNPRVFAKSRRNIEELVVITKKFKSTIKELEIAVASIDSTKSIQKIRELENSLKRMKNKLAEKDEENESLGLELSGAKIAFGEKVEALEKLQIKYEKIVNKMKNRGQTIVDDELKISNLVRELEQTKIEAQETQKLKDELNELRVHVANFVVERSTLLEQINKSRALIKAKENEILIIEKEKKIIERTQIKDKNETEKKLIIAGEEIKCLREEIDDLKAEIKSNKIEIMANEATKVELNQLQSLLQDTNERLSNTSNECTYLKNNCNDIICEKTKLEFELSRMKIQNEALIDHLNSEKMTTAETLKDSNKLMADYQLQEFEIQRLKSEKSTLENNLTETEREKEILTSEVNKLRDENINLNNQLSSLKSQLQNLTQNLEDSDCRRTEIESEVKKLEEENKTQRSHLESLIKENDRLNNELDNARSDKLNIAGTLNDWRLQYEETKNLLDAKVEEAKFLDDNLKRALQDSERLKLSEAAMKLEVTKSLEANVELRGSIDVLNSDKTNLEEQLTSLNNECQALKSRLGLLQSDNEALEKDSSASKQRVDKLSDEVKKLMNAAEENARERRETTERHQRKLKDFEIEHNALKGELLRLRSENSSLKSDTDRISLEYEKLRSTSGKKGEISRLTVENEGLKFELSNLRNSNAKADREIELAKNEREKLCQELCALYTEKCTLKMRLEKMKTNQETSSEDSRQIALRFNELKMANDQLQKSLEGALNDIANHDYIKSEMEGKLTILQNSVEELKQRHCISESQTEQLRSHNENLVKEINIRNKENIALMEEVNALRSTYFAVKDDNSKMRTEFAQLEDELEALKAELARARAENGLLKTQFEAKQRESCKLESENAALKDKLEELKHSKILDAEEEKILRTEYEKLQLHKVILERKLTDAQKGIGEYKNASSKLNGLVDKLPRLLKCAVTKQLSHNPNEEIEHLYRPADSCINNTNFKENIEAT